MARKSSNALKFPQSADFQRLNPHLNQLSNTAMLERQIGRESSQTALGHIVQERPSTRKKRKEMTRVECEFSKMLEIRRLQGEIAKWDFEGMTFRRGTMVEGKPQVQKYTPDFVIFDSIEEQDQGFPLIRLKFIEVKGPYIWPGAKDRFKLFQLAFPMFEFQMIQSPRRGEWNRIL